MTGSYGRYAVEPNNSLVSDFSSIAQTLGGGAGDIMSGFTAAIQQQMYWQYQMQMVTMKSNTEKSKHECEMVPLRNLSVR